MIQERKQPKQKKPKTLKVRELIRQLQTCDPEKLCWIAVDVPFAGSDLSVQGPAISVIETGEVYISAEAD